MTNWIQSGKEKFGEIVARSCCGLPMRNPGMYRSSDSIHGGWFGRMVRSRGGLSRGKLVMIAPGRSIDPALAPLAVPEPGSDRHRQQSIEKALLHCCKRLSCDGKEMNGPQKESIDSLARRFPGG